ncbi:MAG: SRPBCC family protein [Alcanivoracaceae bacterium]
MQRIEIHQEFSLPVEKLFAYLSEHENLEAIFYPTRIRRIADGQGARNGIGSARQMRALGGPAFVETVTAYRENELIEYRITKGSPLKNHLGVMRFSSTPTGSHLHYTIEFEGRLPLIGPIIRAVLDKGIRKGLNKISH